MEAHRKVWKKDQYYWQPTKEARKAQSSTKPKTKRGKPPIEYEIDDHSWTKAKYGKG